MHEDEGPTLGPACLKCGAIGSVKFMITDGKEVGFECEKCGAAYEGPQSEYGEYDAVYDLAVALFDEPEDDPG